MEAALWNRKKIYCGSGSDFGNDLVPVPAPVPIQAIYSSVCQQQKICSKSFQRQHYFP
jgi:hypothetical protein